MSNNQIDFGIVAVLGMGTMGAGIAQVIAASGRKVIVLEADADHLRAGMAELERSLDEAVGREKLTAADRAALLQRVHATTTVGELAGAELVIESVTEHAEIKAAVLREVAAVVGADTPICTNTSALSVTELAAGLPNPARVAGLHFFNPAPAMRTVEVITAEQTDDSVVERLTEFVDSLDGKLAVVVGDRPGFLINALLMPYLNDVIAEYDNGLASAEDIDLALQLGLGYKTGPLEMLDMVGLDVHLQGSEAAYEATGDNRYKPPPLLRRMVAAGRLGNKSGGGFRGSDAREDS